MKQRWCWRKGIALILSFLMVLGSLPMQSSAVLVWAEESDGEDGLYVSEQELNNDEQFPEVEDEVDRNSVVTQEEDALVSELLDEGEDIENMEIAEAESTVGNSSLELGENNVHAEEDSSNSRYIFVPGQSGIYCFFTNASTYEYEDDLDIYLGLYQDEHSIINRRSIVRGNKVYVELTEGVSYTALFYIYTSERDFTLFIEKPLSYEVVVDDGIEHGTVTSSVSNTVEGQAVWLKSIPEKGYYLSRWNVTDKNGDAVPVNNRGVFTMPSGNVTVSAVFDKKPTLKIGKNESLAVNEMNYDNDDYQPWYSEYIFCPEESGRYRFYSDTKWYVSAVLYDGNSWIRSGSSNTLTGNGCFFNLEKGKDYILKLTEPSEDPPVAVTIWIEQVSVYNVSVDSNLVHGKIETSSYEYQAGEGEKITLSATPDSGYYLLRWIVSGKDGQEIVLNDDSSFIMPAEDVRVSCEFAEIPHIAIGEQFLPNKGSYIFVPDETCRYRFACASNNYAEIDAIIYEDDEVLDEEYGGHCKELKLDLWLQAGRIYKLSYYVWSEPEEELCKVSVIKRKQVNVTVVNPEHGVIGVSNAKPWIDDNIKISVEIEPGYYLSRWIVTDDKGAEIEVDGSYFRMPSGNVTVSAEIIDKPPALHVGENVVLATTDSDSEYSFVPPQNGIYSFTASRIPASLYDGNELLLSGLISSSSDPDDQGIDFTAYLEGGKNYSFIISEELDPWYDPTAHENEHGNNKKTYTSKTITITRLKTDINDCVFNITESSCIYDGKEKCPDIDASYDGSTLIKDTDYKVTYSDNVAAGEATVTVTGIGQYEGEKILTFLIEKANASLIFASESVSKTSLDSAFANPLSKDTDGAVTYRSSNKSVATVNKTSGLVTIKGIGTTKITATAAEGTNYKSGEASYTLVVTDGRKDISDCKVTLSPTSYTYNGSEKKPTVTVKEGAATLTLDKDYSVSYENNTDAGTATVKVTGMGKYKGDNSSEFTINKAVSELIFASESITKTSLDAGFTNPLTKTTDGNISFVSSETTVATVDNDGFVTIKGVGETKITAVASEGNNYKAGEASYVLKVTPVGIEKASVAGVSLSYGYSGKSYTPAITVTVNGAILAENTDYTLKFKNNKNPGTATITITGKGKYTGTRIKNFEIVDCVSSIVSGKTYQLIPKNNSKTAVCSYSGKMVNNTKVYITDRSSSEAMKFKAIKNSDGTWKFINAKCELALAVQQNSSEVGKGIVLYDQTTKKAQNWKLSKKSDNSFAIMNAVTGYSIAMSDASAVKDTTLSMAETASSGLQRFYIAETTAVSTPFDGTYGVKASKDKKFALNIASSSKNDGANVNLYTYSNTIAKKFKVMYSGGGYYRLVNVNSGLCLTVKGNTKTDGANVIQSKWAGDSGQRWKITKNSDGTVSITNALGTVLHLNGNKTANGTNVVAKKTASTKAQRWYLE